MLSLASCGRPEGTVFVTVDSLVPVPGDGTIVAVAINAGRSSQPAPFPMRGYTIPPAQTLRLVFPPDRSGPTTVQLEARNAQGAALSFGQFQFDLTPGYEDTAFVTLGGTTAADMGTPLDMASLPRPSILTVSPPRGSTSGGAVLTISGQAFASDCSVTVGGVAATPVRWLSDMRLEVVVPANPGKLGRVPVVVTNPDGQSAGTDKAFSYYPGTIAFLAPRQTALATYLADITTADFNRDGKPDIAVAPTMAVALTLSGNGDGSWAPQQSLPIGNAVLAVAARDINGDGNADLAVVDSGVSPRLAMLLGQGDGKFSAPFTTRPAWEVADRC